MPRIARQKSESGIYHIMLRGANRQEIFHDDEDCRRFLETLDRYKKKSGVKVYGWCLMGNHVHLLLGEGKEDISITMKRIGVSYVWFYNWKYKTIGHLFQDRYKSENIEKDEYLMAAVRYIHQNPVKAGIAARMDEWKWSSIQGYYGKPSYPAMLLDSGLILGMLSENKKTAIKRFKEYNEVGNEDKFLEDTPRIRLTDDEARAEIIKLSSGYGIAGIKNLPKAQRDEIITKIKEVEGLSQRQAARILGISPNLIFKT
ncbi:REP element-mobilizing transposase RayT [Anaerobacterium chartisolvens]|uniref:REP element-mobilizing transposase RayT n=2 Tax=Anaerobacterium chartisolvens TaxID=1297424 RepID=A0A369AIM1_9FIRM|nr:REP element-mobilizing transposase RayT [Anaerobacterium chartisolvens]